MAFTGKFDKFCKPRGVFLFVAALVACCLSTGEQAQAAPLPVGSSATLDALFFSGTASAPMATLSDTYEFALSPGVFGGTVDSAVYHDVAGGKTIVSYTITQDPGAFFAADSFEINDDGLLETFNAVGIETAGYIVGSPPVLTITTFVSASLNSVTYDWDLGNPINPGESATIYMTYNGLLLWSTFNGIARDGVGGTNTTVFATLVPETNNMVVPEPTTLLLMGLGLFGVAVRTRRRK